MALNRGVRYPFLPADSALGEASLRPMLPIRLDFGGVISRGNGLARYGSRRQCTAIWCRN